MFREALKASMQINVDRFAICNGDINITYGELNKLASKVANHLLTIIKDKVWNVKKDSCGLLLDQDEFGLIGIISCVFSGITYVPIDNVYPLTRIEYMIDNVDVGLLLTNTKNLPLAQKVKESVSRELILMNIDDIINNADCLYASEPLLNHQIYYLYTSGSTGRPKAILQKGESVEYFARSYIKYLNIQPTDRMTLFSTYGHDAAVVDIFSALLSGACLYPIDLRNTRNILGLYQWLQRNQITVWHSVPSFYRKFWSLVPIKEINLCIRVFVLGGEKVRKNDFILFRERFDASSTLLYNLYGQTESTYTAGRFIINETDSEIFGTPISGTEVIISCDTGSYIKIDCSGSIQSFWSETLDCYKLEKGEILVKSPYIVSDYINESELSEKSFINTGDLGRLYRTGDLLEFQSSDKLKIIGRNDSQVKVNGYRVELAEIENQILTMEGIKDCAVVAKEENNKTDLYAFIISDCEYTLVYVNNILRQSLPDYMLLFSVKRLKEFPITVTGKVNRSMLKML